MSVDSSPGRYLAAMAKLREKEEAEKVLVRPFLTISRQAGAGGNSVGERVVKILNQDRPEVPWTLFDHELVEAVLKQHNLPRELSKYLNEETVHSFEGILSELFKGLPSSDTLFRKTRETIVALAELGNCVLIGRGSNFLTSRLPGGFRLRLVASRQSRLKHIQERFSLREKDAEERLKRIDEGRREYVNKYFRKDLSDVLAYDCVINTTGVSYDAAARMIVEWFRGR